MCICSSNILDPPTTTSLNCNGTDPDNSDSFTVPRIKGTKAWEGIHCTGVNSDGPRADHWRTPKSKVVGVDTKPATITDCILSVKCISNQDSAIDKTPKNGLKSSDRMAWSRYSKAALLKMRLQLKKTSNFFETNGRFESGLKFLIALPSRPGFFP